MYTAMNKEITTHKLEDGSGIEFEATLDGEIVGWYDTRIEAEAALDAAAYRRLQQQPVTAEEITTDYNPSLNALESAYKYASQQDMPATWRNALDKAYNLLLASGGITVIYAADGSIGLAYIPSQSEPSKTYLVNGHCTCQAGQHGKPCAHRAAKRLLNIAAKKQTAWAKPAAVPVKTAAVQTWNDDLFKPEDGRPRHMTAEQWAAETTAEQRTGVSKEQALAGIMELYQ
jgi:hypothetical protein